MIEIRIDPEFQNKIPPMPKEDFEGLRQDILNDGYVRDPLVVWKEENLLLDGHHRWRIIQENAERLGDKFSVDYKSFPDRWACIAWICANQLHKHNMTELQRQKLLQEEYDARLKTRGGDHKSESFKNQSVENQHFDSEDDTRNKTRANVAEEHGVSQDKVRRAVAFGRALDKAEELAPGIKNEVLSGEVKARASEIASLKNRSDEEIQEAVHALRSGERIPKKEKPYVQPTEEISIGDAPYDENDFKEQISYFPKEFDDSIRLFLTVHGDMMNRPGCKAAFRAMLKEAEEVIKKYKEVSK